MTMSWLHSVTHLTPNCPAVFILCSIVLKVLIMFINMGKQCGLGHIKALLHVIVIQLSLLFGNNHVSVLQWRRYTRARQVKWPGWKIHRPDSSPAYCFASVIVWTENTNVTISDRFICFILTVKRRWRPVFWERPLKSASGWPDWRIFWPRNNLAPLLRWRHHCCLASFI